MYEGISHKRTFSRLVVTYSRYANLFICTVYTQGYDLVEMYNSDHISSLGHHCVNLLVMTRVGRYRNLNFAIIAIILSMIDSFVFKDDNFDPCFQSIWLKIKCYSIFQLHILKLLCDYLLFNCNCDNIINIGRPKSCDTIIAV